MSWFGTSYRMTPTWRKPATRLIESKCTADSPGLVNMVVPCEPAWVLGRGYGYPRAMLAGVLRGMLSVQELHVDLAARVWSIRLFQGGRADFPDYLVAISNRESTAEVTYTFNRKAAECDLFTLVPVRPFSSTRAKCR